MVVLLSMLAATAMATAQKPQVIPTVYEAGHFYAVPETVGGRKLRLLVDTGGGGSSGMYWITAAAAKRLHLKTRTCQSEKHPLTVADLPGYKSGHGLPPPVDSPCGHALLVFDTQGHGYDGMLGAGYLPGHVWTFDYPAHRLLAQDRSWHPDASAHAVALGFPHDAKGEQTSGFARITIRVDDHPVDMLLDTGATAHPSIAGEKASGTPTVNGIGVTSYIDHSMFERWHKAHPDWRVVDKGDDLFGADRTMRLIEVPKVEIAGWSVGPVWFTERPDHSFRDFMSSMMDKTVDGAVGGNVFRHFVMTIDYPHATAYFRCMQGCKASHP